MPIELRHATLNDASQVLSWLADASACLLWAGPNVRFPTNAHRLWLDIDATPSNTFALYRGQMLVGFGQLVARDDGRAHLARLIVSPGHRGQGLGRVLCEMLMTHPPLARSAREFTLNVYPDNGATFALYLSLGFTVSPEQPRIDIVHMSRLIGA